MKLSEWMRLKGVDDDEMARRVGDCTGSAVRKWKYGERNPPGPRIARIEVVTDGEVTFQDWFPSPPTSPSESDEAPAATEKVPS